MTVLIAIMIFIMDVKYIVSHKVQMPSTDWIILTTWTVDL